MQLGVFLQLLYNCYTTVILLLYSLLYSTGSVVYLIYVCTTYASTPKSMRHKLLYIVYAKYTYDSSDARSNHSNDNQPFSPVPHIPLCPSQRRRPRCRQVAVG